MTGEYSVHFETKLQDNKCQAPFLRTTSMEKVVAISSLNDRQRSRSEEAKLDQNVEVEVDGDGDGDGDITTLG